ncbi:uroporphyrinogen decarboxylase family protein [Psychrilyobacter atlanticus]|uniref:uroporphyrinogen decarboxylase family protein n=1 Tax=Psychrilyobacter atlanticus TaxID=271091 RepID=UPI00041D6F90|nr:uroporphyrinogen decarboxylase family protein [Psychrilyobacter atlanticus]
MTLMEYINREERGYLLPFMGANGPIMVEKPMEEIYASPEEQLMLAKKMEEKFPSDFIYALDEGNLFCDVMGVALKKPGYDFSMVMDHPIKTVEDLEKLEIPDPYTNKRMKTNLKSLNLISENIDKPLFVSLQGPFTMAVQLAGATGLLKATIKNPDFVKKLLEFTGEVVDRYAKAIVGAGVKMISIAEPSTVMLAPKKFPEMVLDNLNKIFKNLDCWKCVHICGDTSRIYPYILETPIDAFSFDQIMDMEEIIEIFPKDKVVIGNLDPIYLLGRGSVDEVTDKTAELHNKMRKYDNYLMAFGCSCINTTPIENLETVSKWGRASYEEIRIFIENNK